MIQFIVYSDSASPPWTTIMTPILSLRGRATMFIYKYLGAIIGVKQLKTIIADVKVKDVVSEGN